MLVRGVVPFWSDREWSGRAALERCVPFHEKTCWVGCIWLKRRRAWTPRFPSRFQAPLRGEGARARARAPRATSAPLLLLDRDLRVGGLVTVLRGDRHGAWLQGLHRARGVHGRELRVV